MPKVSPEHVDARRAQILAAAQRCFARDGVRDTTMAHIFAEAGLSAGAVYNYFSSKHEILQAVFDHYAAENEAATRAAAEHADGVEALRAILLGAVAMFDDPEHAAPMRFPVMVHGEALRDPEIGATARAMYRSTAEAFRGVLVRLQAEGRVDPDIDAEYFVWAAVSGFEGWRVLKLLDPHLSSRRFAAAYEAMLAALFSPPR